jgi:hypothetical protein
MHRRFMRSSPSVRLEEGLGRASRHTTTKTKPSLLSPRPNLGRILSSSSTRAQISSSAADADSGPGNFLEADPRSTPPEASSRTEGRVSPLPPSITDDAVQGRTSSRSSSPAPSLSDSTTFSNGQLTPRSRNGSQFNPNSLNVLSPPSRFSNSYYQTPSSSGRVSRVPSSLSLKRDD